MFQHPVETYGYAFFFSLSGYLGVNFVLTLIKTVGALLAVTGTAHDRQTLACIFSSIFNRSSNVVCLENVSYPKRQFRDNKLFVFWYSG